MVLLDSLCFAFFVTALFSVLIPNAAMRTLPSLVWGTAMQVAWDAPGTLLGNCVCARAELLPSRLRRCCGIASLACLACHLVLGLVYGLAGVALVALSPLDLGLFARTFATSKALAFATGVLTATAIFGCLRRAEVRAAEARSEVDSPRWSDAGSLYSYSASLASSPGRAAPVPQPVVGESENRARVLM